MNLFVKKLLAKYVNYIEIIGFIFVILFIAGLVALSQIKAEDEFISLNGKFEINKELFRFPSKQVIINTLADTSTKVETGDNLIELTDHKKYISDQEIIKHLETQINSAQEVSDYDLVNKFSNILSELKNRTYMSLDIVKIHSNMAGDFFSFVQNSEITEINQTVCGVFDFENCTIKVTEFPVAKQQKKKLKLEQTGNAILNLGSEISVSFQVQMKELRENEMIFEPTELLLENKQKIATFFSDQGENDINVSLSVLVGSKSWMNLIWR